MTSERPEERIGIPICLSYYILQLGIPIGRDAISHPDPRFKLFKLFASLSGVISGVCLKICVSGPPPYTLVHSEITPLIPRFSANMRAAFSPIAIVIDIT